MGIIWVSSGARSWSFLLLSPRTWAWCNRETTALKPRRLENGPDVSAYLAPMPVLQFLHQDVCKGFQWVLWRKRCYIQLHSVQTSCYARLAIGHLSHFRKNPSVWCRPKHDVRPLMRKSKSQLQLDKKVLATPGATSHHHQSRRSQSS